MTDPRLYPFGVSGYGTGQTVPGESRALPHQLGRRPAPGRSYQREVSACRIGRRVVVFASETETSHGVLAVHVPFPISPADARRLAADLLAAATAAEAAATDDQPDSGP